MADYFRPSDLNEAVALLASGDRMLVLAGGTDIFPAHVSRPLDGKILDVTSIGALRGIARDHGAWRIGAATTWSDVIDTPLPGFFDALKRAAAGIGGRQIQNTATIGGNICNASPAADGVAVLMAMGAEVELISAAGRRRIPLEQFIVGNRQTNLRASELLTAIHVRVGKGAISTFCKLGSRRYLVISIVMVAIVLEFDEDLVIQRAGIAVGACSPVAKRLPVLEQRLIGLSCRSRLDEAVDRSCMDGLTPIDDIRATAHYRLDAALTLLRRALAGFDPIIRAAA